MAEEFTLDQVLGNGRAVYAASILFIFPSSIWEYLSKIQLSPRGEFEMQSAVQMMIEDGYKAYGVLQPAPQEWTPEFIKKVESS